MNLLSKSWVVILLVLLLVSSCSSEKKNSRTNALPFYKEATFTPYWYTAGEKDLKDFHTISDFELINQDGKTITQKTLSGKIYVTDFFFTSCPGLCPKMTANMSILQDTFLMDNEVMLVSHSVTPVRDSVSVLKAYADKKEIDSKKWHLLTGSRDEIYSLGRNDYFVEEDQGLDKKPDDFLHTENFVLIDKTSHIRGIYNGLNKTAINQLIADIQLLKKEG